jgi:hypothetical protein
VGYRKSNHEIKATEMVSLEIKDCHQRSFNLWIPYIPPDKLELIKLLCKLLLVDKMNKSWTT